MDNGSSMDKGISSSAMSGVETELRRRLVQAEAQRDALLEVVEQYLAWLTEDYNDYYGDMSPVQKFALRELALREEEEMQRIEDIIATAKGTNE